MKWFKHFSDAYTNLKLQTIKAKFGLTGYGFYWVLLELVAQQGETFRIEGKKSWKEALEGITNLKPDILDEMLDTFARMDLINEKAYKQGVLYVPKLGEHSDEYTARLGTRSGHSRDNVGVEEKKKRREEEVEVEKKRVGTSVAIATPTPADKVKDLFSNKSTQESTISWLAAKGVPIELAGRELAKFISYWTELNKTGTKQRWEKQPTFEIGRRLATWFNNYQQFNNAPKGRERKVWTQESPTPPPTQ